MIDITLTQDSLSVSGHSGTAEKGNDIVCAAVSALSQALLYGLGEVIGIELNVDKWENGALCAKWAPEDVDPAATVLIETIRGSLIEISRRYAGTIEINKD